MILEFKLPEVGENITAGTVVRLAVKPGERVAKEQTLLELETDKATIEVPSPVEGVIAEICVSEGAEVQVGQIVARIDTEAAEPRKEPAPAPEKSGPPTPAPKAPPPEPPAPVGPPPPPEGPKPHATEPPPVASPPPPPPPPPPAAADVPAPPSVRRLAREIGVNLAEISGSGPGGRISKEDVKAHARRLLAGGGRDSDSATISPLPDFSRWGPVERRALSALRKKASAHLSEAWRTIPHVTQFDKVEITELERLRKQYSTPELKLTITPFLIKVVAAALKKFPRFNASIDPATREVILKKYYHIGVAVDTEHGLMVPVVRDVDKKSIVDLAREIQALAERARARKLGIEEMRGGTFTITNLGGIGGTAFTPIINAPEVAILGVSRARTEPNYDEGKACCSPVLMLPLSLSYDHRLIDGADGARFLRWITEAIRQPFLMELQG